MPRPLPTPIRLVHAPTPVRRLESLSSEGAELWLKDDGQSHPEYGGNKLRKLEWLLSEAQRRGARRIVTSGAAGSHHVMATSLFARRVGLSVAAVICPQPHTDHAERMLRLTAASGAELSVVGSMAAVPFKTVRILRRGDYLVPPGGSNVLGTLGYLRAVGELVMQVRQGQLGEPDMIVAPLGSGGTVAGLLAGVLREGLRARIVGVEVATAPIVGRAMVLALSAAALHRDGGSANLERLRRQLEVDGRFLGDGYGAPTAAGELATAAARSVGLGLDPTYTAKTFARVLEVAETPRPASRPLRVLYWHTLSAAPLEPLLLRAPSFDDLPQKLQKLLPRSGAGVAR